MNKSSDKEETHTGQGWSAIAKASKQSLFRRGLFSVYLVVFYLLLNDPHIILVSDLGFTLWFPATGLIFAAMLCLGPRYFPVAVLADALGGALIYHQPFLSWGETLGSLTAGMSYAAGAYLLRGPLRIDAKLSRRYDVVRYLLVAMGAALLSTLVGVTCLVKDHSISPNQFWDSLFGWYIGDLIALLGVSPFLLIHFFPRMQQLFMDPSARQWESSELVRRSEENQWGFIFELAGQLGALLMVLWIMFGGTFGPKALYYLSFLPVIWIAMRQGIQRVVSALLIFDFGVVVALYLFPISLDVRPKVSLLMLALSATGLLVGSEVTERHRIAQQLKARTDFLNSLIEHNPLAMSIEDTFGRVQSCNDAFTKLFQYSREEIAGQPLEAPIPTMENSRKAESSKSEEAGQFVRSMVRRKRKDGEILDLEVHTTPIDLEGGLSGTYVIHSNVSEQVKAAEGARQHAESLNRLVTELQLRTTQMTLLNELSGLLQCCGAMQEAFGTVTPSLRKLFSASTSGLLFIFRPTRDAADAKVTWGQKPVSEGTFAPAECWSLRRGQPHWSEIPGETIICQHLKNPVPASYLCVPMVAQGETLGVLHVQYDRSESAKGTDAFETLQESQQRLAIAVAGQIALSLASLQLRESLRDQSLRDPLTGLFNRRFLQESLDRELRRARRKRHELSLALLDIDHFKRFNDLFGHEAGDMVLRTLAQFLLSHFRGDDMVCRHGGEEFALILPESTATQALKRAEQFRTAIKHLRVPFQGKVLDEISVSIGIASFPLHGTNAEELLRAADSSLYRSKSNGRDRVTVAQQSDDHPSR